MKPGVLTLAVAVAGLVSLILVRSSPPCTAAEAVPSQFAPPVTLAEETLESWRQSGASAGWFQENDWTSCSFVGPNEAKAGDLPGFKVTRAGLGAERLSGATIPSIPFGLHLDLGDTHRKWVFPFVLINEQFSVQVNTDADLTFVRSLERFPTLKQLTIYPASDLGDALAVVGRLPHLVTLQVWGLDDAGAKAIAASQSLQSLELRTAVLTEAGFRDLARMPRLKELDLFGTTMTIANLQAISESASLESLRLFQTDVTDEGISTLTKMRNLRRLDLSDTDVTGATFDRLRELPLLSVLVLDGSKITDSALPRLAGCDALEELNLRNTIVTDAGLQSLPEFRQLRKLCLYGTNVRGPGLQVLSRYPKIQSLNLGGTTIAHESYEDLVGLKHLQSLVASSGIGLEELRSIARIESLRRLDLRFNGNSDARLKILEPLNLELLAIDPFPTTERELLSYIAAAESSVQLSIPSGLTLSGTGAKQINQLRHLQSLSLSTDHLSSGVHLNSFSDLQDLRISDDLPTDGQIADIAVHNGLRNLTLYFPFPLLTQTSLLKLADSRSLKAICLGGPGLTD